MQISVIVTIYNAAETLRQCIDSIINQKDFTDYEVILIDDGSTDDSYEICKEYAEQYPKLVRAYTFSNKGVATARYIGVTAADGDFVVFCDSDDTLNPDLLKRISDILMFYPHLDIIRYQVNLLHDEDYKDHNRHNCMTNAYKPMSGIEALRTWTGPGMKYALYWLYAFRRRLFIQASKMPELRCFEDVAYIPLLIANSNFVITIDYVGYNYECNNDHSLTNDPDITRLKSRTRDFLKACDFAVSNFEKLDFVSKNDIEFFKKDYEGRLKGYFYSLPAELRGEFATLYCLPVNRED